MAPKAAQKRRRDYVKRQNPKFFKVGLGEQQPGLEAVNAEYDRLVAKAQYDRNPAPGKEPPPPGVDIAVTPPLKPMPTPEGNELIDAVEAFLAPSKYPIKDIWNPEAEKTKENASDPQPDLAKQHKNGQEHITKPRGGINVDADLGNLAISTDWATDAIESSNDISQLTKTETVHGSGKPKPANKENKVETSTWCLEGGVQAAMEPSNHIGFSKADVTRSQAKNDIWTDENPITTAQNGNEDFTSTDFTGGDFGGGRSTGFDNTNDPSWQTIGSTRGRRDKFSSTDDTTNLRVCFNCGKEGHRKVDCPEPPKPKGRACHKCGEEGHLARDCRTQTFGSGSGGETRACFKCNQIGHLSRDCPTGGGTKSGNRGCFNCGEHGHRAAECPSRGADGYKSSGRPGGGSRGCYKCGQPGHLSRDCPGGANTFDDGGFDSGFETGGFDVGATTTSNVVAGGDNDMW